MTPRVKVPGRGWAYTGAILGGVVSIAANVAHSFLPPDGAQVNWRPEIGAVVSAVVWPVFLFIALEILVRNWWPKGIAWGLLRWAGLLPIAGLAGLVSYRHLSGLLAHYGEEPIVYYAGPLAVDGLMVMATGALYASSRLRKILASAPQVQAPSVPEPATPAPIAAPSGPTVAPMTPPPLPNLAVVKPETPPAVAPAAPSPAVVAARVTLPRTAPSSAGTPAASRSGPRTATRNRPGRTAPSQAAKPAPPASDTSVAPAGRAQPKQSVVEPALLARVRDVARAYLAEHGVPITSGQVAVRLKVTSEQATQALAVLNLAPDSPHPSTPVNGSPVKATR